MTTERRIDGLLFGASSGVGAALAHRLGGRRFVAASRRPVAPSGSEGQRVLPRRCDIRRYDDVEALFREVSGEPLDFVVNCVGVGYYSPLTGDYSDYWRRIFETNVLGLLHVASNLLRHQPFCGCFVHVGSLASRRGSRTVGNFAYTASKVAAPPILDQLRQDLHAAGSPTRVILVSPGYISGTDFAERYFEPAPERAVDLFAGAASLSADQVARAIQALLEGDDAQVEIEEIVLRPKSMAHKPQLASDRGTP